MNHTRYLSEIEQQKETRRRIQVIGEKTVPDHSRLLEAMVPSFARVVAVNVAQGFNSVFVFRDNGTDRYEPPIRRSVRRQRM